MDQLQAIHNTDTWFVSMQSALKGLTEEQAYMKAEGKGHSIQEIVRHLNYYHKRHWDRFTGLPVAEGLTSIDETFGNLDRQSWNETISLFDAIMSELTNAVETCDEDTLIKGAENITYLTIHAAYHIGQIVHIRKAHGSWNPANGIQ
ncbi:DinB family protein [Bacillus sp. REN3]|uniref:DinB family protein n=1 Tax=Bacillus sp. REN3 TaxID=2802440 RepID=UPI001AEE3743|nr:DinB family protein [Bacillus sp. REN3]